MSQATQAAFGTMGRQIRKKLRNDNDAKVLVVGQNSQTGIGKTTFAIQLCRYLDQSSAGWSAEDKAFLDVGEYIDAHMEVDKQSCLLLDEIEAGADSRRSMSQENVDLSHAWMTMRARNVATVATLPSVSALDKRMLELADYWVLVLQRGVAQPYEIVVNDFKPNRLPSRVPLNANKNGDGEIISFPDFNGTDPDKEYLDKIKDQMLRGLTENSQKVEYQEHVDKVDAAIDKALQYQRDRMITDLYRNTDLSTSDLGELEITEVSQSQVSRIKSNFEERENLHTWIRSQI